MGPDLRPTPPTAAGADRCPACAAALRPGAPWCTLCYADLRPAPAPVVPEPTAPVRPAASAAPAVPAGTVGTDAPIGADARADAPGEPTWPCTTCGARNGFAVMACGACGAGFLAGLREAEGPLLELPGVGDLTRLGRGQRMALAGGVVLVVVLLTLVVGLLLS